MSGGAHYPRVECPGGHFGGGTLHPMTPYSGIRCHKLFCLFSEGAVPLYVTMVSLYVAI